MIVFHGSDHIVDHPVLNGVKRSNDYGSGFYTTESLELAKEWACAKNTHGFAKLSIPLGFLFHRFSLTYGCRSSLDHCPARHR